MVFLLYVCLLWSFTVFFAFSFTLFLFFGLGETVQYVVIVMTGLKKEIHYAKKCIFFKFCIYAKAASCIHSAGML